MDTTNRRPVRPVSPLAGYIGGKRLLAQRLIERIEAVPHHTYCEPFVGMGGVFLRRPTAAPVEVINDRSRDVATLFRILQRHYVAFLEMLRFQLTVRSEFERLTATDPDTLTDLERAARFLYLQRVSYGGKVVGRTFGVDPKCKGRFNITRLAPILEELHERLSGVVIECLDYAAFIRRYDRADTLFYIDPPYVGHEGDYGAALFTPDDTVALADLLRAVRGRFIVSINDVPQAHRLFDGFSIEPVETTYSISGRHGSCRARELIITGP